MTYIYDRPDWPNFRWDEAALAPTLAETRFRQGKLLGRMQGIGVDLQAEASLGALTEDALKSSEIEGEILDRAAVRSSFARHLNLDVAGLFPPDRRVDGVVEMLLDATQAFDAPLTAERLFRWHTGLFPDGTSGLRRIAIGAWRTEASGPMQVISGPIGRERVHFEAPAATRLDTEMIRFLSWFEDRSRPIDPFIKAAVAHIWFVTIHPFEDGNGRIARAIADLALARSERTSRRFYSLSSRLRAERNAYYEGLEAAQKGDLDITDRLFWFLTVIDGAFSEAEITLTRVVRKSEFWDRAQARSVNDRQRGILNRILDDRFEGKLTTSKWAKMTKCSQDTALRDVEDLVSRGLLAKSDAGGRSTHYVLSAPD